MNKVLYLVIAVTMSHGAFASSPKAVDISWDQLVDTTANGIATLGGYKCSEIRDEVLSNINLFANLSEYQTTSIIDARSNNSTQGIDASELGSWLAIRAVGFDSGLLEFAPPQHFHFSISRSDLKTHLTRVFVGKSNPSECK